MGVIHKAYGYKKARNSKRMVKQKASYKKWKIMNEKWDHQHIIICMLLHIA